VGTVAGGNSLHSALVCEERTAERDVSIQHPELDPQLAGDLHPCQSITCADWRMASMYAVEKSLLSVSLFKALSSLP